MTGSRVSLAIALVLVLVQIALVARAAEMEYPGDRLEPLCEGKATNLTLRSHLDSLLGQADDLVASGKCSEHIHQALKDLKELLGYESDRICTLDKAEKIKAYYLKYFGTSTDKRGKEEKLPKSLRLFVLGYGMRASKSCRLNMILDFKTKDSISLVGEHIFYPSKLLSRNSILSKILNAKRNLDDILLPSHLGQLVPSGAELRKHLSVVDNRDASRKKTICERIYRPIYKQAILPVTVLASIGLAYRDRAYNYLINPDYMRYWSQMVFVCELIRAFEVGNESRGATHDNSDIRPNGARIISFVTVGEVVYDRNDAGLVAAVRSFKTIKSESKRVERRILNVGALTLLKLQLGASLRNFMASN